MSLSADLISQFVQVTKPKETKKEETTVYGVAKVQNGSYFVQLDGSELLTPMITTSEVVDGERIAVMIKNHKAICLGNVDSPAARIETVNDLGLYLENLIIGKADIGELTAISGKIVQLEANDLTVNGKLSAAEASISTLETNYAKIETLETNFAAFETATAGNFTAVNARIDSLDVGNLQAEFAELKSTTTETLEAVDATIKNLDATYVNIDFSNITQANILDFYATSGVIADARIENGKICGTLEAVTVKGDLIEAGTIAAEKLVIKGEDGLFYQLNYDGKNVTGTQTDYNSLNGKIITAKSITANQITVTDLVAFGAKLANFTIDDSADGTVGYIYSGAKGTVDNPLQGIYMDSTGQMNIGNDSNYIKFYEDGSGGYKLDISAATVKFGTNGSNVESLVNNIHEKMIGMAMSMGNVNLLNDSDVPISSNAYSMGHYKPSSPLVSGKKYTISVCITPAQGVTYLNAYLSAGFKWICMLTPVGTGKQIITKTFTCGYSSGKTPTENIANSYIYFYRFPNDSTVTGTTTIHWAKVVEGDMTTGEWVPSWDDIYHELEEAKNTTPHYMYLDNGLVITKAEAKPYKSNVRIDDDSVDIRYNDTTLASFGSSKISLGVQGANTSSVDFNEGALVISEGATDWDGRAAKFTSVGEIQMYAPEGLRSESWYDSGNDWGRVSTYFHAMMDTEFNMDGETGYDIYPSIHFDVVRGLSNDINGYEAWSKFHMNADRFWLMADTIELDGAVYSGSLNLPNNTPIRMMNKDGSAYYRVMAMSTGDSLHIGVHDDTYSNDPASVKSNIWLNAKNLWFKVADPIYKEFKPYYTKNDSISFGTAANALCTTAYISSSSKTVYFVVPVSKPILSTSVTAASVSGFKVRQENQYLYGSSASTYVKPASYTATVLGGGTAVGVQATFSTTTNAINNHVCGIEASIKLTFG